MATSASLAFCDAMKVQEQQPLVNHTEHIFEGRNYNKSPNESIPRQERFGSELDIRDPNEGRKNIKHVASNAMVRNNNRSQRHRQRRLAKSEENDDNSNNQQSFYSNENCCGKRGKKGYDQYDIAKERFCDCMNDFTKGCDYKSVQEEEVKDGKKGSGKKSGVGYEKGGSGKKSGVGYEEGERGKKRSFGSGNMESGKKGRALNGKKGISQKSKSVDETIERYKEILLETNDQIISYEEYCNNRVYTSHPSSAPTSSPEISEIRLSETTPPIYFPMPFPVLSPSVLPSSIPSVNPSKVPSMVPFTVPSKPPSRSPFTAPSVSPSINPSLLPSSSPSSSRPTRAPSKTSNEDFIIYLPPAIKV